MRQKIKTYFALPQTKALIKKFVVFLAAVLLLNLIAINFVEIKYLALFNAGLISFWLAYYFSEIVFYVMIFLFPFINFQLIFDSVNVPYVDLIAAVLFGAWIYKKLIVNWFNHSQRLKLKDFPGLFFAVLFFVSAAASIFNSAYVLTSAKFLLRPLIFFYLVYLVLPYNLIVKKIQLKKIYHIIFVAGVIVALIGLISIFFTAGPWYQKRAMPYSFGDFNPLGGNQNAIAEVLVVTIPITLLLIARTKKYRSQAILLIGLVLMAGILLLTFSRSGWLALLLELIILFIFGFGAKIKRRYVLPLLLVFIVLPVVIYFTAWQNISWVQTSNLNRILLTEIAVNGFLAHPFIGNGLNMFSSIVSETFVYVVEFGDPLESHGFLQKIMTEQGLFGLITFLGLLTYIFFQYILAFIKENDRSERFIILCLLMMLAGIVFFELFSTSYYISRMWLPIGIGLAAVSVYQKNNKKVG